MMVVSKDDKILEGLQTRVVGDYLCYRLHQEQKITFRNLNDFQQKHEINLENLLKQDKTLIKYVVFDGLSNQSFLRFKENHFGTKTELGSNGMKFFKPGHLLNVTIKNSSYVYDLDK